MTSLMFHRIGFGGCLPDVFARQHNLSKSGDFCHGREMRVPIR